MALKWIDIDFNNGTLSINKATKSTPKINKKGEITEEYENQRDKNRVFGPDASNAACYERYIGRLAGEVL